MAKKEQASNPRARRVTKYGRVDFELTVSSNQITVGKIVELYKNGALKEDEWVFTYEDMLKIAKEVAYGFYNYAALKEKPTKRHALEERSKMVRKIIFEAFTANTYEKDSKGDG